MGASKELKDVRVKLRAPIHAALKVLCQHEHTTLERWIQYLVEREVQSRLTVARQLTQSLEVSALLSEVKDEGREVVYFIRRGNRGPIKIGKTRFINQRLATLQTGCAEKLQVLAQVSPDQISEEAAQAKFRHLHRSGEWFSPDAELLQFIDALNQSDKPDKGAAQSGSQQ